MRFFTLTAAAVGLLTVIIFSPSPAQPEATFPRFPASSPDGSMIAFSYAGDIWTVPTTGGHAARLTTHSGYEYHPRWSPDGQWIAFDGDREGFADVYIIPAAGGQSQRLTWLDTQNHVCCWTPGSDTLIFASSRDDRYPDYSRLYSVPLAGGTPMPVIEAYSSQATLSPDGGQLWFTFNGVQWWRKGYRGSQAGQVWQYDRTSGEYTAVTDTLEKRSGEDFLSGSSSWPMAGANGVLYLLSDRDGTDNLWKRSANGAWSQLTHYAPDGARFPNISADGSTIVFEQGLSLYVMRDEAEPQAVSIIAPRDDPERFPQRMHYSRNASRVAFSPAGRQLFVEVRGEVFAGRIVGDDDKAARKPARSLSNDLPSRDGDFTLSPGGDSLIFVSDRDGDRDLYLVYSDDSAVKALSEAKKLHLEQLTNDPAEDHGPVWSPDGKSVLFVRGKGELWALDLKERRERLLRPGWSMMQYVWSPDGQWIAYACEDDEFNSDVFILPAEGGASVNVSRHPDEDEQPVWSADGKKLGFRSKRRENNWDIYFVFLQRADDDKYLADWAEERWQAAAKDSPSDKKKNKDKEKDQDDEESKTVTVSIDTTDIFRRVRSVTSLPGEEGLFDISPDGENFVFAANFEGEWDIYSIKWTSRDQKRLTNGGKAPQWLKFSPDGKRVRFLDKIGLAQSVKADGGGSEDYPFDAYMAVDVIAERLQKFDEVWRGLNDEFYHPNFHGHDWAALRDKYRPMVPYASSERDFGDIINMMIGELNSSHCGYGPSGGGDEHNVGRLGLDFDPAYSGEGLQITHVLPKGPCDRLNVSLQPGDVLLAINDEFITPATNIHRLLDRQVDEQVYLTYRRGKEEQTVTVRPMGRWLIGRLTYDEWVQARREEVDRLSDGKLGYLHIQGMGEPSLARFEAELYSRGAGKEGLVIDVRFNGGGYITDYLLTMLEARRHAVTFPRGGGPGYPQGRLPLYSWVKPIVVLCNEHSFSNAEIFSHAIQTLGRGQLVGVPTAGGVISTDWRGLLDGSGYRVPMRGWYIGDNPTRDESRNMEGHGAVPDVIVPMRPDWISPADDAQLRAAVKTLE